MIRLNTPIESLVINLQSAGNVQYNIQYVIVRQGTRLEKSTEGLLTSSGQNVVLINDFSSGYFDITYINVTNIDPTENFISVLKKTNVSEFNLTSEAIGLKNRECTEFTSESGFKVLDQNGSFKTITESVSADGDVENSDMTYMASVPSGGTLTLPDSDIEVNGVGEGVVVSVKTISVDLNDGTDPVSPTLVTLLGNTLTITLPDIGDVTIENSDATYQVVEASGGTLVLPDSQINFNGVDEGDVVSVKAINVNLTDGVDPIVPTSVGLVGNTLTITLASSGDVDIEINGIPFDTIAAPATIDIPVINTVPIPVGTITGTDVIVGDSSAVIKNSAGTTIKTEAIPAEVIENITINDSTAVIKDSIGTTLKSENILAEASENITINNSTVNIRDTAANLLHSVSVRAEATTTQDIADTTVENSDASYSVNVLAEGSLTLPDSQINVNSVDSGDVVSVKTIDVNLEDSLGAPVVPTSVGLVGNTLTIEVPSGATPMNVDFSADKLTALIAENITFTDLSDQTPTHWSWRFSDGTTSLVQNPVKSFTTLGFKNITLMAGKVGSGGVIIKNSYIEITGDADALAFFARVNAAGGTLTSTEEAAIYALVGQLKTDGIWNSMKAIYPMVGASAAACAQNLKSSSFTGTFNGGWSFASTGATPNGTNAFMNTGLNENTELTLNSTHLSFYSRTNNIGTYGDIGNLNTSIGGNPGTNLNIKWSDNNFYPRVNDNNAGVLNTGNSLGLFITNRINSTQVRAFRNTTLHVITSNSIQKVNLNFYIGATNSSGSAAFYSNRQCAFASIGDGLTDTQAGDLNTAVQAFNTSLSRQV